MRIFPAVLAGMLGVAAVGATWAQADKPASSPAAASAPMTAASRQVPTRNAAITASENAKEPGNQRPDERVIPQISLPLKPRTGTIAATTASAPAGNVPGGVDDGAARCLATGSASDKAACDRGLAASGPVKLKR
jgi:hypothetical protein